MAESADRAAQSQAAQAEKTAGATAGSLQSAAQGVGSTLIPSLERDLTNAPGMSPADLATMQQRAAETAGGAAGTARGLLASRAARLRNPANVGATTAAAAEGASRAQGSAVQDILAQNAKLKEAQRSQATGELGGIYGTDVNGMLRAMSLQPEDINAEVNAGKSGWYQNTLAGIDTLANAGKGAGAVMTGMNA